MGDGFRGGAGFSARDFASSRRPASMSLRRSSWLFSLFCGADGKAPRVVSLRCFTAEWSDLVSLPVCKLEGRLEGAADLIVELAGVVFVLYMCCLGGGFAASAPPSVGSCTFSTFSGGCAFPILDVPVVGTATGCGLDLKIGGTELGFGGGKELGAGTLAVGVGEI